MLYIVSWVIHWLYMNVFLQEQNGTQMNYANKQAIY